MNVPIDSLDQVLDVAASVLEDYAPEAADGRHTRIDRMARWITLNMGSPIVCEEAGGIVRHALSCNPGGVPTELISVWRVGNTVGIECAGPVKKLSYQAARDLAAALIRAVEAAEAP